ncbi:hypothetical protein BGZ70_005927 [Mortierella alpina]|uniref:FAD-binding domain-containing protein n=1 Tax=Mortierella alpina TaxID=64518 RepID=A0A9P6J8K4_MORAP|nr:hypothetical protein BGZ70_005927 [Mortierella alpina]
MVSRVYRESDMTEISATPLEKFEKICGYNTLLMSRPDLHALLLSHVPSEKILMGKKVVSLEQDADRVTIQCGDNSTYHGDLVIGSDGAYSAVRSSLYKQLAKDGLLPVEDMEQLKVCHMSILGTTTALDPKMYKNIDHVESQCDAVIGDNKPHTWRYFSVPGDRICWRVDMQVQHNSSDYSGKAISSVDWGTELSDTVSENWRSFKVPLGGTIGDLINSTPDNAVSKVALEEKLYKTWHHGRVVLIGDAAHKMLPNSGRGAVNAMLDAVVLANTLYEMPDTKLESITSALAEYYEERYDHAVADLVSSQHMARLLAGQTWLDRLARMVIFNLLPDFVQTKIYGKSLGYRPQLSFLPQVPSRGSEPVLPQKPSAKYERQQQAAAL